MWVYSSTIGGPPVAVELTIASAAMVSVASNSWAAFSAPAHLRMPPGNPRVNAIHGRPVVEPV
jgi:hypothetical protein